MHDEQDLSGQMGETSNRALQPSAETSDAASQHVTSNEGSRTQAHSPAQEAPASVGHRRLHASSVGKNAGTRQRQSEAPRSRLHWRALRSGYDSGRQTFADSRSSAVTSFKDSASRSSSSSDRSTASLFSALHSPTSTLVMREMEAPRACSDGTIALRMMTEALSAMQRDQRRSFSRLMQLQERNLDKRLLLLRA